MKHWFSRSLVVFALAFGLGDQSFAQQRITVSYPGIAGYNIPFWVALDGGEFKKAGLDVEAVLISGGTKSMQALLSGGLDCSPMSAAACRCRLISAARM